MLFRNFNMVIKEQCILQQRENKNNNFIYTLLITFYLLLSNSLRVHVSLRVIGRELGTLEEMLNKRSWPLCLNYLCHDDHIAMAYTKTITDWFITKNIAATGFNVEWNFKWAIYFLCHLKSKSSTNNPIVFCNVLILASVTQLF